jgi:amidohydrolase
MLPKGNGVICDVGRGEPVVALRADLDALPMPDAKDVPYRSTVDNVCHGCGHDVHTAILVGVGRFLASVQDLLPGRVRLLFQPAEEALPCGSFDVIGAGGLDQVSEIFALHCDPTLLTGQVGLRVGSLTSAADNVAITIRGPGGHTARPHLTVDIIDALGRLVSDAPAVLSRRVDTRGGLLLVFGQINAGTVSNVIPTEGYAAGVVRMLDHTLWEQAPGLVTKVIQEVLAPTGAAVEVDYLRGRPPVINDPAAVKAFTAGATAAVGEDMIVESPQSMGGEDFSWYLEEVPGAMARLGVGRPGRQLDLHQGNFDVDENAIAVGVRLMTYTAFSALARIR